MVITPEYCKDCYHASKDYESSLKTPPYNGSCASWLIEPNSNQCVIISLKVLALCRLKGYKEYAKE